jgi:hypothetical protein
MPAKGAWRCGDRALGALLQVGSLGRVACKGARDWGADAVIFYRVKRYFPATGQAFTLGGSQIVT